MRRAFLVVGLAAGAAHADTWTATGEAGAELDTNVQRVETGPGLATAPVSSSVIRFGARADGRGRILGGGYVLALSDLTRYVTNSTVSSVESVTLLAADARWLHPLGDRPVSLGFAAVGADALPLDSSQVGARTFSNWGGDALLAAHDADSDRLLLAVGGRAFEYKPDHTFDWAGPTASARLDLVPWQEDGGARSVELAITAGFEARAYNSYALVDSCAPGAPPDPMCPAPTTLRRHDRFQRVGIEATWVGRQIAALGYQLIVIDSNSYGQSLIRHRATASITSGLPGGLYATLLAILQLDRYLDGLVLAADIQNRDFTNIEDENRSSLQLRVARKLSTGWSIEGRAAYWRNIGNTMDLQFQRELVYLGVVYTR